MVVYLRMILAMEDNRQNVDNHLIVNGADVVDQRCLGDDMFILFLTYLGYKVTTDLSSMFVSEIMIRRDFKIHPLFLVLLG